MRAVPLKRLICRSVFSFVFRLSILFSVFCFSFFVCVFTVLYLVITRFAMQNSACAVFRDDIRSVVLGRPASRRYARRRQNARHISVKKTAALVPRCDAYRYLGTQRSHVSSCYVCAVLRPSRLAGTTCSCCCAAARCWYTGACRRALTGKWPVQRSAGNLPEASSTQLSSTNLNCASLEIEMSLT